MKQALLKFKPSLISLIAVALINNCSGDQGLDVGKQGAGKQGGRFDPGTPESNVFDFQKECGLSPSSSADSSAPIFAQQLKSLPIVTSGPITVPLGGSSTINVIAEASVQISAQGTGKPTTQDVQVRIVSAKASGVAALLIKPISEGKAADQSGQQISNPLPNKDWIKLTGGENPAYKNLLCAFSGTQSVEIRKGKNGSQGGTVTYSPALVSSVSPLAPIERIKAELGNGRMFTITAQVTGKGAGLKAGTRTGKTTIRMVSPQMAVGDATLSGDVAIEVVQDFGADGAYSVGLQKRSVYFINAAKKQFSAILLQSDELDSSTKKPKTDVVLIAQ